MAIPTLAELEKYNVNRPGEVEGIRQSLYDSATYAGAGQTSLTFFQVPVGQSGKTKADTNMEIAGSLPAPKRFFVTSIQLLFFSGVNINEFTAVAADQPGQLDDLYTFSKNGYLDFFIGSKSYLTEAPLGRFPSKTRLNGIAASSNNSATTGMIRFDYAALGGQPYVLDPGILLVPTQNFNITLNWPAAVALPSGAAGKVFVVLDGVLYRNSQ